MSKIDFVNCPNCRKSVSWDKKSLFRPFCSKRCQLIDLSKWIQTKINP